MIDWAVWRVERNVQWLTFVEFPRLTAIFELVVYAVSSEDKNSFTLEMCDSESNEGEYSHYRKQFCEHHFENAHSKEIIKMI